MSLRTGAQYLEGLRDGREVWLDGERVPDVTKHPKLAGAAAALAENFDIQRDPSYGDLLTSISPRTGEPISRAWHLPRSAEDLAKGREMFESWERRCGGVLGRHPQYIASLLMGVYGSRDRIQLINPEWAANIANHYDYCRENDLAVAFSAIDPYRDRKLPPSSMEYLRVVETRPEGVLVRGAQMAATHSVYADEYLSTVNRRDGDNVEALYFCIPVATKGLKLVCRPSMSHAGEPDHPLSGRWDEMDVWVIFDEVLVPRDRIFLHANESHLTGTAALTYGFFYGMLRQVVKAEALIGICFAVADYLGVHDQPPVQAMLAEAVTALESLRSVIRKAEETPIFSSEGLAMPNPAQVALARVIDGQTYPRLVDITRQVCGSSLIIAPGENELNNPETGPLIRRYVAGGDERAFERFKMLKLAWEYVGDSFGQRQLLFEEHASVNLTNRRVALLNNYDASSAIALAKQLAGIEASA